MVISDLMVEATITILYKCISRLECFMSDYKIYIYVNEMEAMIDTMPGPSELVIASMDTIHPQKPRP